MDHFELVSQYPAAGHRRAGQRLQGRQPIPDFTRGYGFRQNFYDGERHPAIK